MSVVCVNAGLVDLNRLAGVKPEFCNDLLGGWYINKIPLTGHFYNPEKDLPSPGDTQSVTLQSEYTYRYLGTLIKGSAVITVQPAPKAALRIPAHFFGRCDTSLQLISVTGSYPLHVNAMSKLLTDGKLMVGNAFIPSQYDTGWHTVTHIFTAANGCSDTAIGSFYGRMYLGYSTADSRQCGNTHTASPS